MRTLALVLTALTLLLLQSALGPLLPAAIPAPAFGTLVALHVGLSPRWSLIGQVSMGFFAGYLFDLLAGAPQGTHALLYTLVALLFGRLARRISVTGVLSRAATSFGVTLVVGLAVVGIRALVSHGGGFEGLRWAPVEAAITALVAPPVLALLERIDGRSEGPRARGSLHRRRQLGGGHLPLG